MTTLQPIEEACRVLGVSLESVSSKELKQCYRKAISEHPPDRDPDGFRRVRKAYEVLLNPREEMGSWLAASSPHLPLPGSAFAVEPLGALPRALLRVALANISADDLGIDLEESVKK